MRLIDADAMHKYVEDKVAEGKDGWANGVGYEWAWALTAVDMQPTIDAVEVVRCKDCKHWKHFDHLGCTDFVKVCGLANYMIGANGFCLYGERRDNDA